ncbi:citrate/2-methylcitrate synthase [Nonomuraea sp. ZG12]|uniref:citrate/2-methylcitrate synthase n=1 Tax=Nonomuraea sp. ZG12 TaxID=3452207 RepID=UPI003F8C1202
MEWIDAATAAERLGIKPATLYAYVSRGLLKRRHDDSGRRSLFDAAEIEQLARRGRPRGQPPELVIESAITALGLDRPHYRGHDALTLARTTSFETVAEWLWTADPALLPQPADPTFPPQAADAASPEPDAAFDVAGGRARDEAARVPAARDGGPRPWTCDPEAVRAAVAAQRDLPDGILPLDRLQVITTVLGASDSLRYHLDPASVTATGRSLIAGLVEALPALQKPQGTSIAERLWPRLTPNPATPALLRTLEAALVLLADHELAASTLAARVAASARADPYAVVLTGLGVLGGPLHGGASYAAERLLHEVTAPAQAPRVIADRIRRGERIPGFGHSVYKNGDARGRLLLDLITEAASSDDDPAPSEFDVVTGAALSKDDAVSGAPPGGDDGPTEAAPGHDRLPAARAVLDEVRRRRLPEQNVDFALATFAEVTGMISGAGEAIFAIARTAGWLAHAMEEYATGSLLRLRASYIGPPIR